MKTKSKHEAVSRIALRGLLLVGLLATALTCVCAGEAQSGPASAPAPNSKTPATMVKSGTAAPLAVSHPASGLKSGVKVHGYWKIDVKNPDGKPASHTEFENSLTTNDPNGLSGDDALALLLSGGPSSLTFTSGTINTEGSLAALQAALNAVLQSKSKDVLESAIIGFPYLVVGVNTDGFNYMSGIRSQSINYILPGPCGSSPCLAATSQSVNGTTISLSTTFGATAQGTISEVGTFVSIGFIKYDAKGQGQEGTGFEYVFPGLNSASYTFTSATLGPAGSCGGAGQPPCQVSVSPGQTVSVSVALSFN